MKTIVYIDGFNFYYGACRRFGIRWVNPRALALHLLPDCEIVCIRYFSAIIKPDPSDPQKRPSRVLSTLVDFTRQVRRGVLEASQFPTELEDADGAFHKPPTW